MNNRFRIVISAALLFVGLLSQGQELILPLGNNPDLQNLKEGLQTKKSISAALIQLPIIDDFSYDSPYPDSSIWADNYTYINRSYGIDPPSIGVATMDAIDQYGSIYSFATISPNTFEADLLTSRPIDLDYPASDSIYLSFFFQPMGNGLQPKPADSLCLDFYDPDAEKWITIWNTPGDTLRPFKQVMIPVDDERFLKEGFKFGFRNLASLPQNTDYEDKRGNVDHWNIDYVRLDRQRRFSDTIIRDVAFNKPLSSMLSKYQSLPWEHLPVAYNSLHKPHITINYFNNDSAIRNISRELSIYDEVWNERYNPNNITAQDIEPGESVSYNIESIFPFNFEKGDTASLLIRAALRTDVFDNKANDTIYRTQVFKDYFAYDDGSAERAYGLKGQGTNSSLIALKFQSFIPDEIGGVDIYFTQLMDSLNLDYYYKFMVWNDINGKPGNVLYDGEIDHTVVYSDKINKFTRIKFKRTVPVTGVFYVGLLQYNQYLLNIGMDINTPPNGSLFYNLGASWELSEAPGSIMLRPYVKRSYSSTSAKKSIYPTLTLWPNPASEYLNVEFNISDKKDIQYHIFDISGRELIKNRHEASDIHIGNLPAGLYMIQLRRNSQVLGSGKFIISH